MKVSKGHTLFFLLLIPLVMGVTNSTLLVQATTYNIIVEVSSPIQNKTYFTNDIPLSFNYSTNMDNLPNIAEYSVVFVYNLDGEPNFDMFGNPVFWGKTTRIGQFYQPIPLDYNSSIHVPNGNHTLFVSLTFWITPEGEHTNIFDVTKVSQVVNFTVSAPTPPIPEFPSIYIRADGSVEGTDRIQRDGDVYTLTSDINGSIIVERDNVVLNGAGYRLKGNGNENGITFKVNNITVRNLKLSSFNIGIVVMGSDNNKILENTITDNFRGLDLTASENNTVSRNYIKNNTYGIALENINNTINENTITNNNDIGIFLNGAGYNNIIGNNITDNKRGIVVSICYDNVIYHNNFVNNTNHVEKDDSNGIWDNGEEGNYWDKYTGLDSDGDGIGNTPYVIDHNNQDNYPLLNPWIPPNQKSEPFPITWILVIIGIIAIVGVAILVFFIKTKKARGEVK